QQTSRAVVRELIPYATGECVHGSDVAAMTVKDVDFPAIFRRDGCSANTSAEGWLHDTDAVIVHIGDVQVAIRAKRNPKDIRELRLSRETAIAAIGKGASAGDGCNDPIGSDAADATIVTIRDIQAAIGAQRNRGRVEQCRQGRGPAIAAVAEDGAYAGDRCNDSINSDAADAL